MYQPNPETALFCNWLLTSNYTKLTPARVQLFTLIRDASVAITPVTNIQWFDFIRATSYLYPAFLQSNTLTAFEPIIVNTYGLELVTNGGFDDASAWTCGAAWSISGGKVHCSSGGGGYYLYQPISYVSGHMYELSFEIVDFVLGGVNVLKPDLSPAGNFTANGQYKYQFIFSGPYTSIYFINLGGAVSNFAMDNVSIKEILW